MKIFNQFDQSDILTKEQSQQKRDNEVIANKKGMFSNILSTAYNTVKSDVAGGVNIVSGREGKINKLEEEEEVFKSIGDVVTAKVLRSQIEGYKKSQSTGQEIVRTAEKRIELNQESRPISSFVGSLVGGTTSAFVAPTSVIESGVSGGLTLGAMTFGGLFGGAIAFGLTSVTNAFDNTILQREAQRSLGRDPDDIKYMNNLMIGVALRGGLSGVGYGISKKLSKTKSGIKETVDNLVKESDNFDGIEKEVNGKNSDASIHEDLKNTDNLTDDQHKDLLKRAKDNEKKNPKKPILRNFLESTVAKLSSMQAEEAFDLTLGKLSTLKLSFSEDFLTDNISKAIDELGEVETMRLVAVSELFKDERFAIEAKKNGGINFEIPEVIKKLSEEEVKSILKETKMVKVEKVIDEDNIDLSVEKINKDNEAHRNEIREIKEEERKLEKTVKVKSDEVEKGVEEILKDLTEKLNKNSNEKKFGIVENAKEYKKIEVESLRSKREATWKDEFEDIMYKRGMSTKEKEWEKEFKKIIKMRKLTGKRKNEWKKEFYEILRKRKEDGLRKQREVEWKKEFYEIMERRKQGKTKEEIPEVVELEIVKPKKVKKTKKTKKTKNVKVIEPEAEKIKPMVEVYKESEELDEKIVKSAIEILEENKVPRDENINLETENKIKINKEKTTKQKRPIEEKKEKANNIKNTTEPIERKEPSQLKPLTLKESPTEDEKLDNFELISELINDVNKELTEEKRMLIQKQKEIAESIAKETGNQTQGKVLNKALSEEMDFETKERIKYLKINEPWRFIISKKNSNNPVFAKLPSDDMSKIIIDGKEKNAILITNTEWKREYPEIPLYELNRRKLVFMLNDSGIEEQPFNLFNDWAEDRIGRTINVSGSQWEVVAIKSDYMGEGRERELFIDLINSKDEKASYYLSDLEPDVTREFYMDSQELAELEKVRNNSYATTNVDQQLKGYDAKRGIYNEDLSEEVYLLDEFDEVFEEEFFENLGEEGTKKYKDILRYTEEDPNKFTVAGFKRNMIRNGVPSRLLSNIVKKEAKKLNDFFFKKGNTKQGLTKLNSWIRKRTKELAKNNDLEDRALTYLGKLSRENKTIIEFNEKFKVDIPILSDLEDARFYTSLMRNYQKVDDLALFLGSKGFDLEEFDVNNKAKYLEEVIDKYELYRDYVLPTKDWNENLTKELESVIKDLGKIDFFC